MTPAKAKTKKIFNWKTATPAERAAELLRVGDSKTAQTELKDPCCICNKVIKSGQEYRLFFNNNKWKGHETCIMNGGKGVAQIRAVVKTEDGTERIYWDQLTKPETAYYLMRKGVTFRARANTDRLCDLCGKRLKPGELCRASDSVSRKRVAHLDEAERGAKEWEAKLIAEKREIDQRYAEMDEQRRREMVKQGESKLMESTQTLAVAEATPEYESVGEDFAPSSTAEQLMLNMSAVTGGETEVSKLQLEIALLKAEIKGMKEAMSLMSGRR